jgi:hypothetical protein
MVSLERRTARVGVVAVDLDREGEVAPENVHLVTARSRVHLEAGDAGTAHELQQLDLRRGAGSLGAAGNGEDALQLRRTALAAVARELVAELVLASEAAVVGLRN